MCLLTFIPPHIQPNLQRLENGTFYNDDGHGFAIVIEGRIVVRRAMNADRIIDEFGDVRAQHPEGPAIFHSRMGTHGVEDKSNVHPFWIGRGRNTVIAHNGVFPVRPMKKDPRSDTRVVVEDLIPKRHEWALNTHKGRVRFSKWMGRNNKVAILTTNPRFKGNSFIINVDSGIWDDGIWYSNDGYSGWNLWDGCTFWDADKKEGKWLDGWLPDQPPVYSDCWSCMQPGSVSRVTGYCTRCYRCQECAQLMHDCQCWPTTVGQNQCIDCGNIALACECR